MKQDLKLIKSKSLADGAKYFSLFDGHIPTGLNGDKNIYLYRLGNVSCICSIIKKNPEAVYYICDEDYVVEAVKINMDEAKIRNAGDIYEEQEVYKDMKFDCVIMNPPYDGNLHLQIVSMAILSLKDNNSKVINLSPVRWLQDPLAKKYKKTSDYNTFNESIIKHIMNLNVITAEESRNCFSNGLNTSTGIYVLSMNNSNYDVSIVINPIIYRLIDKIYLNTNRPDLKKNKKDGWRVRIQTVMGGSHSKDSRKDIVSALRKMQYFYDGMKDGKPWYEFYQKTGNSKNTSEITHSIQFNSEIECINYVNSLKTYFCTFFISESMTNTTVQFKSWPWMGDAINPRTGKKGYESEWTDEDFYQFFDITDDEKKMIEDAMAKYVKKEETK